MIRGLFGNQAARCGVFFGPCPVWQDLQSGERQLSQRSEWEEDERGREERKVTGALQACLEKRPKSVPIPLTKIKCSNSLYKRYVLFGMCCNMSVVHEIFYFFWLQ